HGDDMKKYRRLKRYWGLLLKYKHNISNTDYKYYPLFGQRLEESVINELLDYDEDLKMHYHLYQSLLECVKEKNFTAFSHTLRSEGDEMKKYRRLKRYWGLLLKYKHNISNTDYKYYPLFGQRLEESVINELLDYDEDLKMHYHLYQSLLECVKEKNFTALSHTL